MIEVVPLRDPRLDSPSGPVMRVLEAWEELHASSVAPESPFLHPRFALAVAHGRAGVELACAWEADELVLVVPYERRGSVGHPLGGRIADLQGPLASPRARTGAHGLLSSARLSSWCFDRAADDQLQRLALQEARGWRRISAPCVDVRGGLERLREERRAAGSRLVDQGLRKGRKLGREVGELRFEWSEPDGAVLEQLFAWKAEQRKRTGTVDAFSAAWARSTVDALLRGADQRCRGHVSALYAGERLVAAHLGLATDRVLAWWVPTYDPEFSAYSPGLVLLLQLVDEAARRGIERLELGSGDERYKLSVANDERLLVEGEVGLKSVVALQRRLRRASRDRLQGSSLEPLWRRAKTVVRRVRGAGA